MLHVGLPIRSNKHALNSNSVIDRTFQYLFHFWVTNDIIKRLSIGSGTNDLPDIPMQNSTNKAYERWMKTYKYRLNNNLSTSVSSMIYHTEYKTMILCIFLTLIEVLSLGMAFVIFKLYLWPIFTNDDDDISLTHVLFYALLIFLFCSTKTLCISLANQLIAQMNNRIDGTLKYILFKKSLSFNHSESQKQKIVNIVGSDLHSIQFTLLWIFTVGYAFIFLFIFTIISMCCLVGYSALFGIIFIIFIGIPFQLFFGVKLSHHSKFRKNAADKRVELINEVIRSIRVLKCNASEIALMDNINKCRKQELTHIKKRNLYLSFLMIANFIIPSVMLIITIIAYVYVLKHTIDQQTVLFLVMVLALTSLFIKGIPLLIGFIAGLFTSFNRIDTFLQRESIQIPVDNNDKIEYIKPDNNTNIDIKIENGTFVWNNIPKQECKEFSLSNINLKIERGKLVAIIGPVGCGKSSLIFSILDEMKCVSGKKYLNRDINIAYCSQTAYIRNATLRDNILMDLEYDEEKYKQCIIASNLYADLKILPNHDFTPIGDEGVTLSGGQKMRVAFCRALYRDQCNVFIFDDILSCVDIYVGKQMFHDGILKYIKNKGKTCLMVINSHLHLLKYFDQIVIMDKGEIKINVEANHLFQNFQNNNLYQAYKHLLPDLNYIKHDDDDDDDYDHEEKDVISDFRDFEYNEQNAVIINDDNGYELPNWNIYLEFMKASISKFDYKANFYNPQANKNAPTQLTRKIIIKIIAMILIMFVAFLLQSLSPICNIWLIIWQTDMDTGNHLRSDTFYVLIWVVLLLFISISTSFLMYFIGNICEKSSYFIHTKTLYNILKTKILFFDITPRGKLLNIFSSDTFTMDIVLPTTIFQLIMIWNEIFGMLLINCFVTPISLIIFIILICPILFFLYRKFRDAYSLCIIDMKRNLSPILTLYGESITNLDSIRAYKLRKYFLNIAETLIDIYSKAAYNAKSITAWFQFYQEMLLNLVTLIVILISGYKASYASSNDSNPNNSNITPALLMLTCWYYVIIQQTIQSGMIVLAEVNTNMLSVKRILAYSNKNIYESQYINKNYAISKLKKWPANGKMIISKLQLKYRQHFDVVLDINKRIEIMAGSKIGICGRTGSGKSSILVSIFRLYEPLKDSKIDIDDVDIYKLGLFHLRSNLSIIMQTPILFYGDLRWNLDPFNQYDDNEIWSALKSVQLFELISNRENKLLCNVEENGSNFSLGEKQLICFARAIIQKSKILFMDESTSSIDKNTDSIIQKLLRSEKFKNVTVICIAHRLQTIIDYDYILLLENGKIKEYDKPNNLLNNKNNHFAKLYQHQQ